MTYVPPPDPQCSPVPLGVQQPGPNNNYRTHISNFMAPEGVDRVTPTKTPAVPAPTPTPGSRTALNLWGNNPKPPIVTKTATQTATASNPINPVDDPASIVPRGNIDTGLALPSNIYGPYPQTLFLGCSVASFNVSLGWGNQPSQLSVTLVEDPSPHYTMTYDGGIYRTAAIAQQSSVNHYYQTLKPLRNAQGVVIEDAKAYKTRIASFLDTNGNVIIPGKLFYHYNTTLGKIEQKYWLGPDPGFIGGRNKFRRENRVVTGTDPITGQTNVELGETVDIIGCPVYFQLDDFVFCGIIKSWKSINSGTGGRSYTVDIEGANDIVNQAQLILSNYAGGVFVKSNDSPPADGDSRPAISGPSNDFWNSDVDLDTAFQGNVGLDGNIPNIINIYGFLEAMAPGGFGGANINDSGIKTNSVIYALNYLLGIPVTSTNKPGETTRSVFSPFGALVGRSPMSATPRETPVDTLPMVIYTTSGDVPKARNSIHPVNLGPTGSALSFPQSRVRESSATGKSVAGTVSGFLEIGDDGTVYRNSAPVSADNSGIEYNIFDFGLIPPDDISATIPVGGNNAIVNQQYKQLYYLDLGELPVVPTQLRTDCSQSVIDLNSFITEICDKSGVDFFYEMLFLKVYNNYPAIKIIKLRTVSRRVQPSDRKISDYIARLREQKVAVSSVSLGKEYNSSAKPRTMLIGAKQQRLFQTKNYGLAYRASNYLYDTINKRFISYSDNVRSHPHGKLRNYYRIPNPSSVRDPLALNRTTTITRSNERPVSNFYLQESSWNSIDGDNDIFPARGNYYLSNSNISTTTTDTSNIPTKLTLSSIKYSDVFIEHIAKTLFSWAHSSFVSSSQDHTLTRTLHQALAFWITSYTGASPFETSSSNNSRNAGTEATILSNFARAIAEIGYNVWNTRNNSHYFKNRLQYLVNKDVPWFRDDGFTRFFPIMYNSICPYFGTVDYIDKTKTQYVTVDKTRKPRPVWFDTWLNGLVIEFNVKELPITRLELQGIYNGGTFIVHETEIRAAMAGYDNWMAYLSMRIHDPHIKQMVKNAVCGNGNIPPVPKKERQATRRNEPSAPGAADVGDTSTNFGGQGANKPQQKDTRSDWQTTSDNDWDACAIFCALFNIQTSLNNKTKSANAGAATPKNRRSGLQSALYDDLNTLHSFFKKIGDEYYGKKFMVRLPMILSYRDRDTMINMDPRPTPTPAPNAANTGSTTPPSGGPNPGTSNPGSDPSSNPNAGSIPSANYTYINIGSSENPRYITEGSGKVYSNYNISPEGAWEEYGNSIDDCIMVGGYAASIFTDDSGRIKPILGYPADDKFDHEAFWCCEWVRDNVCKLVNGPNMFYYYDILKRSNALSNASRYTDFPGNDDNNSNACT
jgi:hypothetical protein